VDKNKIIGQSWKMELSGVINVTMDINERSKFLFWCRPEDSSNAMAKISKIHLFYMPSARILFHNTNPGHRLADQGTAGRV
jgi:hypothetical protein